MKTVRKKTLATGAPVMQVSIDKIQLFEIVMSVQSTISSLKIPVTEYTFFHCHQMVLETGVFMPRYWEFIGNDNIATLYITVQTRRHV